MGGPEVSAHIPEIHHAAPRCLLTLHERANGAELDGEGIQAWVEWEIEAMRWRVPVEIARSDLEALVDLRRSSWRRRSTASSTPQTGAGGEQGAGGNARRYGADWFALLALRRWGRLSPEDLEAARVLR